MTDPFLRGLSSRPPVQQTEFYDDKETGLAARVNPNGLVSFFVRYRFRGRQRRDKIGRYPEMKLRRAREETKRIRGLAANQEDPRKPVRRGPCTFDSIAARYVEEWAKQEKRTWQEDVRILDKDLLPAWRGIPVAEIGRRDIRELLKGIKNRGAPVMANRTQALVHRIFQFALDEDEIELSPAASLKRIHRERPESRALTDEELGKIWMALEADGSVGARALQCLALTGQRRQEVTAASFQEIVEPNWWELPSSRTKNERPHLVYLVPTILRILDGIERTQQTLWFPSRTEGTPIKYLNKAYYRARKKSGAHFSPKDFRTTFTTSLTRLGFTESVKAACLNHTPQSVTQRHYDKWHYGPEKQAAFEAWDEHVRRAAQAAAS